MTAAHLLSAFIAILYGALVFVYGHYFWHRPDAGTRTMRVLLVGTILAHLAFLLSAGPYFHVSILNTPIKVLSGLALALAIVYFLIEAVSKERGIGVGVLSLSFLFQAVSVFGIGSSNGVSDLPRSPILSIHIGLALVGYSAFALSMAFCVMYLLLYHEIKIRHLGVIFDRLPSLNMLEHMGYRAIHFGLGFLIVSLMLGEHLLMGQEGHVVLFDPKIVLSLATCLYYGLAIAMRKSWSIQGKRFALVSIAGFLWILVLLFLGRVLSNFHHFV